MKGLAVVQLATVRGDWGVPVPFWDVCTLIGRVADTLRPLAAQ
jgi:hypothetical protein